MLQLTKHCSPVFLAVEVIKKTHPEWIVTYSLRYGPRSWLTHVSKKISCERYAALGEGKKISFGSPARVTYKSGWHSN